MFASRCFGITRWWRGQFAIALLMAIAGAFVTGCGVEQPKACSLMPDGTERPIIVAPHWEEIVLDGDLSDWEDIEFHGVMPNSFAFDLSTALATNEADLSFTFAVCHDAEALYVAVRVVDDSLHADSCAPGAVSCPAWDDDAIEVFIDGNHNHAKNSRADGGAELRYGGEFALVANGAANSDYSGYPKTFGKPETWQGATNWEAKQRGEPDMHYEFRITWSMMGSGVKLTGERIGFTIAAQDDDDGGRREHALYFVGNPERPFLDERFFADVIIGE